MNSWEWECFKEHVTNDIFQIVDCGPLHSPITNFSIARNADLDLILETTSVGTGATNALQVPAGTVYSSKEQVKLENSNGESVIARGVILLSEKNTWSQNSIKNETQEISLVQSLEWHGQNAREPRHTIEWLENMPGSFIWPHFVDEKTTGETRRTFRSQKDEIVLSSSIESNGGGRSCVHISVEGFDLFVGTVRNLKVDNISNPGFILYKGIPSEDIRSKIRNCLSFCLGTYLIYLGYTRFCEKWQPVSFSAVSAHGLSEDARRLITLPPAPLSLRYEWEITAEMLERMVASLCQNYDACNLRSAFWAYWHAIAAPVHMAAVHFGAAIESLQKAYVQHYGASIKTSILKDASWDDLSEKIMSCISTLDVPKEEKQILANKVNNLNFAPQSIVMNRFLDVLEIRIDAVEQSAWKNRNRAAHGGVIKPDVFVKIVRENKVLMILMNRILLAITRGSNYYYDYYTLGRPISSLADPIPNDSGKQ